MNAQTEAPGSAGPGLARFIDHTLLNPLATRAEVTRLCEEARTCGFAAVCVHPVWVRHAAHELEGSSVAVATVIGFPLGATESAIKAREAEQAITHGATELDMVARLGSIREHDWRTVEADIRAVVQAAAGRALVKVILETAALEPVEIVAGALAAGEAGAGYVKTSTGFHPAGGASPAAVALLRLAVGDALGVKASGGIRSCEDAFRMIAAGASRIGTSSGVELVACGGSPPPSLLATLERAGFPSPGAPRPGA